MRLTREEAEWLRLQMEECARVAALRLNWTDEPEACRNLARDRDVATGLVGRLKDGK